MGDGGTILARRAIRKKANKKAHNKVAERGSPFNKRNDESRSKREGETGGARRGVWKARRAIPRKVRERTKSLVNG